MKKSSVLLLLILLYCTCFSQEVLVPLNSNPIVERAYKNRIVKETSSFYRGRALGDTINIPFLDDFSFSHIYPFDSLWADSFAFVNPTFPVNPPTIGVATLDGLNQKGQPYAPNQPNLTGIADYLTSKYINLTALPSDSIYFSFFYQPQGFGDAPQNKDSLTLEFWSVKDSTWQWRWSAPGTSLQDFKYIMLSITDTNYLVPGFRFRFKNYASLAGNFDHWNIDYVYLDKNRTASDPAIKDVAFTYYAESMLKNYREMPWTQYKANPVAETRDSMVVYLRNNFAQSQSVVYTFDIKHNGTVISNPITGTDFPTPESNFSIANKNVLQGGVFPSSASEKDSFEIVNYISQVAQDLQKANDTIREMLKFDHHFSYDDGTAEAGYGLIEVGSQLAYKFTLNVEDKLAGLAMHFTNANFDASQKAFRITVWADAGGVPGAILYKKNVVSYPVYTDHVNGFAIYPLPDAPVMAETIYVGWVQVAGDILNIGFDKHTNAQDKMFINTNGAWAKTQFPGAWMIRPIFGNIDLTDYKVNINEEEISNHNSINIHPNPAKDKIYFTGVDENDLISLYDIYGRELVMGRSITEIDISQLPSALYVVKIHNTLTGINVIKKVIVAR